MIRRMTPQIMPITGTHAEIASVTRRKVMGQAAQARVVAQIMNIAAFVTSKK
jgi:hypothetical protein